MLSLQEISDRLEIQDLLARYSHAIDRRDFAALDAIFTADAIIDYSEMGGARGDLTETKLYLTIALQQFRGSQHLVATTLLNLAGDTATASSICHNPMIVSIDGQDWPFFCGLWYHDRLLRTPAGWRITLRTQEKSYFYNVPPSFRPVPATQEA
jgi:hypothetical protein